MGGRAAGVLRLVLHVGCAGGGGEGCAGTGGAPAEPEKEGADELEGRGVPIEVPGAFEAASPRAKHRCAHLAKIGVRVTARNEGLGWGLEEGAEAREGRSGS